MKLKADRLFMQTCGLILVLTALAKFISASGSAGILQTTDPILYITFQHLFWFAGAVEAAIALYIFFGKHIGIQAGLVAWLATALLLYRCALYWVGYQKPCHCLGDVTDALHIEPEVAEMAMKFVLAYLLLGSFATLFWCWRQKQKCAIAMH